MDNWIVEWSGRIVLQQLRETREVSRGVHCVNLRRRRRPHIDRGIDPPFRRYVINLPPRRERSEFVLRLNLMDVFVVGRSVGLSAAADAHHSGGAAYDLKTGGRLAVP